MSVDKGVEWRKIWKNISRVCSVPPSGNTLALFGAMTGVLVAKSAMEVDRVGRLYAMVRELETVSEKVGLTLDQANVLASTQFDLNVYWISTILGTVATLGCVGLFVQLLNLYIQKKRWKN